MVRRVKIRDYERGLLFRDGVFRRVLRPGIHWIFDPLFRARVDKVSVRDPWIEVPDLDVIARSGELAGEARVLDLRDHDRALVWIDGRFDGVYGPGLRAIWTVFHEVRVEVVDARSGKFEHPELNAILASETSGKMLEVFLVDESRVGLLLVNGRHEATLSPGRHAYWRGSARYQALMVDAREQILDITGQDLMTADKVTLRLNAVVAYRVIEPTRALVFTDGQGQALYREAQLALRSAVGARELDAFLTDREPVARELASAVRGRASALGLQVIAVGIRDVILPGDMKEILNRVTEARKAAEADLITRREETASMRSQANTARIFESSPALMRLRELEVLEKVAEKANLKVVLGEGGLAERLAKLL